MVTYVVTVREKYRVGQSPRTREYEMPTALEPSRQMAGIRLELEHLTRGPADRMWSAWCREEPVLEDVACLEDVVDRLAPSRPRTERDAVLLALVRLAQGSWCREATLVLVGVLQPKLWAMSWRTAGRRDLSLRSLDERYVALQSALVEEILVFNTDRPASSVAASLALNALHRARAVRGPERGVDWCSTDAIGISEVWGVADSAAGGSEVGVTVCRQTTTGDRLAPIRALDERCADPVSWSVEQTDGRGWSPTADSDIVETLAWAVRSGLIARRDAQLLYETYVAPKCGRDATAARRSAAARLGVSPSAVRQRCARAIRAIAAGVRKGYGRDGASLQAA